MDVELSEMSTFSGNFAITLGDFCWTARDVSDFHLVFLLFGNVRGIFLPIQFTDQFLDQFLVNVLNIYSRSYQLCVFSSEFSAVSRAISGILKTPSSNLLAVFLVK